MADPAATPMLTEGMQLLKAGKLVEAEQLFLRLLAVDKSNHQACFALGICCYQSGRLSDAESYLTETISRAPNFLPAYNNLGLVYKAMHQPDRGVAILRRVLAIEPGYIDADYNLALMFEEAGDKAAAMEGYRRVIERKPDFLRARSNLGLLLRAAGDTTAAFEHLNIVATQQPHDVSALVNLSLVLTDLARFAEACDAGARATQLAPHNFSVWEVLGNAQLLGGDASGAVVSLKRAHTLAPSSVELQFELGLAQTAAGEIEAGRETFNAVARLKPDWLKVQFVRDLALPLVYLNQQHIADSNAGFAAGVGKLETRLFGDAGWPLLEGVAAISLYAPFFLHYQGLDNSKLQRRFGRIVETVARRAWPQFSQPVTWRARAHGSRLRVGFVSAYLRRHSVGLFFGNWICQLDPRQFESFVWYTGEAADDVTEKIRAHAAHYRCLSGDIGALATAVHESQLDILIYLDVGMHPHSQVLASLHLAPVQCATFGHPVATGIDSIGYFLSAHAAEPADAKAHYTEKLIRLPNFAVNYARPDVSRLSTPPKHARARRVLCAQPLFKILPHFDQLAVRIVRELPGARLAFIQSLWPRVNAAFVKRISAALREAGVDPLKTLEMLPIMPYQDYLGTLASADVNLDTPGFSGGNSSFDVFAVAAPIITWRGRMLRGRQTAAMLDIAGLPEFATDADDDYVARAIALASSEAEQGVVRERMRVGSAALFDDTESIRALEAALLKLAAGKV